MEKYVSFLGSLLYDSYLNDENISEEMKKKLLHQKEYFCSFAYKLGFGLTTKGHKVKVGSFSELDNSFLKGAVEGARKSGRKINDYVYQILDQSHANPEFIHNEVKLISIPKHDDFIANQSEFITNVKSIVLLGGYHYAKMLSSWAINNGIPIFAIPQADLAGKEIWSYIVTNNRNEDYVFSGVSRQDYVDIGDFNEDPEDLAIKLSKLIDQSSKLWVKPSLIPDDMRYKPKDNIVNANTAFIAMAFRQEKNELFLNVQKACNDAGIKLIRGDDREFYHQKLVIMENITYSIVKSHIFIVDISDRNPNVFYEMGIADTLGKKMIVLNDSKNDAPFDVKALRYLDFNTQENPNFISELTEILNEFKNK